ncbi:MAG: ABC transporter substrate-binding protein [Actinobacteria bacterium]|nr:ABC transporter substrate-binding protein [Actinomycetota bacterium]
MFTTNVWRRFGAIIAFAGAALLATTTLSACGGSSGGSSTASVGGATTGESSTASAGSSSAPASLNLVVPVQADALDTTKASVGALGVVLLGLEPLVRYNGSTHKFTPDLATTFKQVDPLTYTFKLRSGVKFWDGSPLTVGDVLFSLDLHRGPETQSLIADQWAGVKDITAKGDTITIKLTEANPEFLYSVADTGIVSKKYYEAHETNIGSPGVLNMGTGPYEFKSFIPSTETVLDRNESYWGEEAPIAELDVRTISDDSTRLLALSSGEEDGIVGIPLSQLDSFEQISGLNVSGVPDDSVYKFNFDLSKAPWSDIHVRRAFSEIVDRSVIAEGIFKGAATPATTIVPPSVMEALLPKEQVEAGYTQIEQMTPGYDLAAAEKEMAASTVPGGFKTTLLVTGSDPNLSLIGQTVAQEAKKIGIEVQIKQVDDNTYYNAVYFKHTTEGLSLENFGATNPDPWNVIAGALSSANALPSGSGVNIAQYKNAQFDALLAESQQLETTDPERGELAIEALKLAAKSVPYAAVVYPDLSLGLNSGLQWGSFNPFWWMSAWPYEVTNAG